MCADVCKESVELGTDCLFSLPCLQVRTGRHSMDTGRWNQPGLTTLCLPEPFLCLPLFLFRSGNHVSSCRQHKQILARIYWMNSQILKFRSWSSKQFDDTSHGSQGPQKQIVMDLPLECWCLYFSFLVTCHQLPGRQGCVPQHEHWYHFSDSGVLHREKGMLGD